MTNYYIVLRDRQARTAGLRAMRCQDDEAAIIATKQAMARLPRSCTSEIWEVRRLVARVPAPPATRLEHGAARGPRAGIGGS